MTLPFSYRIRLRLLPDQVKVDPHVVAASLGLEKRSPTNIKIIVKYQNYYKILKLLWNVKIIAKYQNVVEYQNYYKVKIIANIKIIAKHAKC